jgi:hypothetical protein
VTARLAIRQGKPGEPAQAGLYHRGMRSPLPLALRPAVGVVGTTSAGPAMAVLDALIIRITILLRGIALAEMVVQVIIWHSFYLASPWLLWGPAVALAWVCTSSAYLRRHRPTLRFVCADAAVYSVLAFGAAWCVPAAIRGEAGSWLFILVTTQAILLLWLAPRALSLPLAVIPVLAFGAGAALAPASRLVGTDPRQASLTCCSSWWCCTGWSGECSAAGR